MVQSHIQTCLRDTSGRRWKTSTAAAAREVTESKYAQTAKKRMKKSVRVCFLLHCRREKKTTVQNDILPLSIFSSVKQVLVCTGNT